MLVTGYVRITYFLYGFDVDCLNNASARKDGLQSPGRDLDTVKIEFSGHKHNGHHQSPFCQEEVKKGCTKADQKKEDFFSADRPCLSNGISNSMYDC